MSKYDFYIYIENLCKKYGAIENKNLSLFLSEKNINLFNTALIHFSVNASNNYEYLEFIGDKKLNSIIPKIIIDNYKKTKSQKQKQKKNIIISDKKNIELLSDDNLIGKTNINENNLIGKASVNQNENENEILNGDIQNFNNNKESNIENDKITAGYLTRITHTLKSGEWLITIVDFLRLEKFLKIDIKYFNETLDKGNSSLYKKLKSDLFESLIGAYFFSCENYIESNYKNLSHIEIISLSNYYTHIFIQNIFDEVDFNFSVSESVDVVTKIKEIYESFGWKNYFGGKKVSKENKLEKIIVTHEFNNDQNKNVQKIIYSLYVFVYNDIDKEGNKKEVLLNLLKNPELESKKRRKLLIEYTGYDEVKKVKKEASEIALAEFKNRYDVKTKWD